MTRLLLSVGVCFALTNVVSARQVDPRRIVNDLKQLGLAYHNYNDANKKAPAKGADLGPFIENDKRLLGLLENKDIVFLYGVNLIDIINGAGTSNTVLAYEKDAPTKGGAVLMADGSVKKITVDEFKKATLAKPKQQ